LGFAGVRTGGGRGGVRRWGGERGRGRKETRGVRVRVIALARAASLRLRSVSTATEWDETRCSCASSRRRGVLGGKMFGSTVTSESVFV
jgi:hypothetical protein